jgi:hypothetical protein
MHLKDVRSYKITVTWRQFVIIVFPADMEYNLIPLLKTRRIPFFREVIGIDPRGQEFTNCEFYN